MLFAGLTLLSSGCAGTGQPVESDGVVLESKSAIFGGAPDDDPKAVPSVVALKVGQAGRYELCSATLIAPNVALTARHCVAKVVATSVACDENGRSTNGAQVAGNHEPKNVKVYLGATPNLDDDPDAVGSAIVAPTSDALCDSDIALVVLDRELADIEPIAVRLGGRVSAADKIRSVGYGQNDQQMPMGTRLRKTGVPILATGKGVSKSKTALGVHEFEVGLSICEGDSGGPALSEDTGAVVGVVSRGGGCENDFGHVYTSTSGWSDLFDQAFEIAGGAPIVESGQPDGPETGPTERPVKASSSVETAEASAAQGCSALGGRRAGSAPPGVLLLALGLACATLRRREARSRG